MTSPDSPVFSIAFGILLLISVVYAVGRLHQHGKQSKDRDDAFRDGYDKATRTLFALATRPRPREDPPVEQDKVRAIGSAPSAREARHRAEDRNATTKVLNAGEHFRPKKTA